MQRIRLDGYLGCGSGSGSGSGNGSGGGSSSGCGSAAVFTKGNLSPRDT